MTTTELLDAAAKVAKEGQRVCVVAADMKHREVLRRGLIRRLDALQLQQVEVFAPSMHPHGIHFDALFVDSFFWQKAKNAQHEWLANIRTTRLMPHATIEGA